jgi:hypothetical protein
VIRNVVKYNYVYNDLKEFENQCQIFNKGANSMSEDFKVGTLRNDRDVI